MAEGDADKNLEDQKLTIMRRFLQHPTKYTYKERFVEFCVRKTSFTGRDEDMVLRKDLIEAFEKHSGVSFLPNMCIGQHLVAAGVRVTRLSRHNTRESCYVGIRLTDGEGRRFADFMNRGRSSDVIQGRNAATRAGIAWVSPNRPTFTVITSSPPQAPGKRKRVKKSPHKRRPFPSTTSSSPSKARGTPKCSPLEAVTASSASSIPLEESTAPSPQAPSKGKRDKKTPPKPRSFPSITSSSPHQPSEDIKHPKEGKQDSTTIPRILNHLCKTGVKVTRLRARRSMNPNCMRGSVDCPGCNLATKGQPKTRQRKQNGERSEKGVERTKNTSNDQLNDRTSVSTSSPLVQADSTSSHSPPDLSTTSSIPTPRRIHHHHHHPGNSLPHRPHMSNFPARINLLPPPPAHSKPKSHTPAHINVLSPLPAHTNLPPPPPAHTKPWTPTVTHINLPRPPPAHSKPREPMSTHTNLPPALTYPR